MINNSNKPTNIVYAVNGRTQVATVTPNNEGHFQLDGNYFHLSDLQEVESFGGGTHLELSEFAYWHANGRCDVRGCCGN